MQLPLRKDRWVQRWPRHRIRRQSQVGEAELRGEKYLCKILIFVRNHSRLVFIKGFYRSASLGNSQPMPKDTLGEFVTQNESASNEHLHCIAPRRAALPVYQADLNCIFFLQSALSDFPSFLSVFANFRSLRSDFFHENLSKCTLFTWSREKNCIVVTEN